MYRQFFFKFKRRSGRKLSTIGTDGLIKPGKSAYNVVSLIPCNNDVINNFFRLHIILSFL